MSFTYGIIIPAFNEEAFLGDMVQSIIRQERMPELLVIVNDASDDRTGEIADAFASEFNWIQVVHRTGETKYATGSKIIETFYAGLDSVDWKQWDVIAKLDADQILPSDYFSRVLDAFEKEPDIGICGGVWALRRGNELQIERHTDRYHVRGGLKTWRRTCFEVIGGIRAEYGNDTLDELLAAWHGWRTVVIPDLKVEIRRPTGSLAGAVQRHTKAGRMFYRLGYGPLIALIASIKRFRIPPYVISSIMAFGSYCRSAITNDSKLVTPEQARFIRKLRYQRMKGKFWELFKKRRIPDDHL